MSDRWEDVELSTMIFAGAPSQPSSGTKLKPTGLEPDLAQKAENPTSLGSNHLDMHENSAREKVGEELRPEADIWQMYRETAKEYDEELVKGQSDNLDMMLLFAALFSAVLSAFLIESKKLLQQDPADASLRLLLLIAQSQQRIEQGTTQHISDPIVLPSFSAPHSARWINGLWFVSLALSLSAALVALLAKEWIAAFTSSPPRPAYEYALLRQARLEGLTEWGALPIMDLLPSMLHLSLLLFSTGLIVYLCILGDLVIAVFIALVTGATLLFYLVTVYFGVTHRFCPFVTRISKYVRQNSLFYFKDWMERKGYGEFPVEYQSNYTATEDIHALTWLANNARDPAIIDNICLSLAGLHLSAFDIGARGGAEEGVSLGSNSRPAGSAVDPSRDASMIKTRGSSYTRSVRYKQIRVLYELLFERLSQAVNKSLITPNVQQGGMVVRYICALPQLVQYLETHSSYGETDWQQITNTLGRVASETINTIYCNACPSLSADSYALLASAGLRLVTAAASHYDQRSLLLQPPETTGLGSFLTSRISGGGHIQVPLNSRADPMILLFDIRARYSLILSRIAYQLHFHTNGLAPIGASALIHLLESVRDAAQQRNLDGESNLSTHHPQSQTRLTPRIWLGVGGASGGRYCVDPDSIGDEYGLLVGLLRLHTSPKTRLTTGLDDVAREALNIIAPILLKQWLNMNPTSREQFPQTVLTDWPRVTTTGDWQIELVLRIAVSTVSLAGHKGIKQLPELAISALYTRLRTDPDRDRAYRTFCSQERLINQLVDLAGTHMQYLNRPTLVLLMKIFLLDIRDQSYFQWPGVPASKLPAFLKILSGIPGHTSELRVLLDVLQANVRNYRTYLQLFINSDKGFSALLEVGGRQEYHPIVAECITGIIELVKEKNETITPQAVLGFFDAMAFAFEAPLSNKKHSEVLVISVCTLLPSFHSVPLDIVHKVSTHPAMTAITRALRSLDEPTGKPNFLIELEELQSRLCTDNLPLEGQTPIFAQVQEASTNHE